MTHAKLLFCALLLAFSSQKIAAQVADSTVIEVTAIGIQPGKVSLVGTWGDQNYIADTTVADANGHFVLRRQKTLPPGFYYFLMQGQKNFSFLIDKEQFIKMKFDVADITKTLEVEGSLNTELFYKNQRFQSGQELELNQLAAKMKAAPEGSEEYKKAKARQDQMLAERKAHLQEIYKAHPNSLFTKFKIAGQNPDAVDFRKPNGDLDTLRQLIDYRARFWDGVDFADDRLLRTPVIANKLRRYMKELTPQNPDSLIKVGDALVRRVLPHKQYFKFIANWIGLTYENGKTNVMDGEAVYVHIVKNYFTPELAFWATEKEIKDLQKHVSEMEASLLGRKGPDVRAMDISGQMKSIYEMTAPLIVVFMYSPDCDHCKKESPEIRRLYEKWKTKGVDFYAIAVNTTESEWRAFHQKQGFTFTNVFDPTNRAIYAKYFVDITPELYLLNKDRTIVAKNLHSNQLEEVFERELKKIGMWPPKG